MNYTDKFGKEIKEGMLVKDSEGKVEVVFLGSDRETLGVNASNENHPSFNEFDREIYPLHAFDSNEFEIVEWEDVANGETVLGKYKKYLAKKMDSYDAKKGIENVLSKFGISGVGYVDCSHWENFYSGTRNGEDVQIVWDYERSLIYVKAYAKRP